MKSSRSDQNMADRIRRLRNAPAISRKLRFDRHATQAAERGFACFGAELARCQRDAARAREEIAARGLPQ
jgi:predicted secreted protein